MQTYTQAYTKANCINARPMTRGEYNAFRGWKIPSDENPADAGYLVEYLDGSKPNHADFAGYVSWTPKDEFEKAYRVTAHMTLGAALEVLKAGKRVARAGWNGKGLWLELQAPAADSEMTLPYIFLKYPATPASDTAPATHINARVPWVASQTDMLAEDYVLVAD